MFSTECVCRGFFFSPHFLFTGSFFFFLSCQCQKKTFVYCKLWWLAASCSTKHSNFFGGGRTWTSGDSRFKFLCTLQFIYLEKSLLSLHSICFFFEMLAAADEPVNESWSVSCRTSCRWPDSNSLTCFLNQSQPWSVHGHWAVTPSLSFPVSRDTASVSVCSRWVIWCFWISADSHWNESNICPLLLRCALCMSS